MGKKVRQNCKWIDVAPPSGEDESPKLAGDCWDPLNHPALLQALRGLTVYDDWVSQRLIPIASKWIEEHREEVIRQLTEEEMDDMGAGIEAAYNVLKESGWIRERQAAAATFSAERARVNPLWFAQTTALAEAEAHILGR